MTATLCHLLFDDLFFKSEEPGSQLQSKSLAVSDVGLDPATRVSAIITVVDDCATLRRAVGDTVPELTPRLLSCAPWGSEDGFICFRS